MGVAVAAVSDENLNASVASRAAAAGEGRHRRRGRDDMGVASVVDAAAVPTAEAKKICTTSTTTMTRSLCRLSVQRAARPRAGQHRPLLRAPQPLAPVHSHRRRLIPTQTRRVVQVTRKVLAEVTTTRNRATMMATNTTLSLRQKMTIARKRLTGCEVIRQDRNLAARQQPVRRRQ